MKRFSGKILLVFMALIVHVDSALTLEPITLQDGGTGNTVDLYPTFGEEDKGLLFYANERFGYCVKIPEIFTKVVLFPDNEGGMILESQDGQYRFRVSGGFVLSEDQLRTAMEAAKQHVVEIVDGAMVFEKIGRDWWELSWWNGPEKGVRKLVTNGEFWSECEIAWPGQPHNAPGEYDELFERSLETLTFPDG